MEARAWRARPRQDANSNRRGWFPAPTGVAGIHAGDRGVPVGGRSVRSLAGRPLPAGGSDRLGRHLRVHCRSAPRWPSSWRVSAGTGAAAGIPGRCPCSAGGSPSARDVVGELVDSYCEWLLRERGLAATTVRRYQATARRFLSQRAGGVDLNDLTAAEVSAFLLAPAGMTPASRRGCRLTESGLCWTVATRSTPVGIRNYSPARPTAWSRSSERWCPGDRDRGDAAVTHTTDQEHLAA